VGLTGNDLPELARVFDDGDPQVRRMDDGTFVLESSSQFGGLETFNEVCDKADPLLDLMNGAMKADDFTFRPASLSNVGWDETGAQHARAMAGTATQRVRARIVAAGTVDGAVRPPPPDPARQIFDLRSTDQNVQDALRLMGKKDLDWITLFKILEIIEKDVGGEKVIAEYGWASRSRLGVFTASSNHQGASGDDARHARMSGTPKEAMTLAEGRAFIQAILLPWLHWQIAGRPPQEEI
jgi:hypothetical protein